MKLLLVGALVVGTLGFGAAEAFGVNQFTGCRLSPKCHYGASMRTGACCSIPD